MSLLEVCIVIRDDHSALIIMEITSDTQDEMMDANLMQQSLNMLGQKRLFSDDMDISFNGPEEDRPLPKKKGRKKSFIWSHVVCDEQGKVHCLHCGLLIRVNIGEKVSRSPHVEPIING